MKALLIMISFFSLQNVFACGADGKSEAQFFGAISNLNYFESEAGQVQHFTYQIKIDEQKTTQNSLCPLDIEAASSYVWWNQENPGLKDGDIISGILVFDKLNGTYSIE